MTETPLQTMARKNREKKLARRNAQREKDLAPIQAITELGYSKGQASKLWEAAIRARKQGRFFVKDKDCDFSDRQLISFLLYWLSYVSDKYEINRTTSAQVILRYLTEHLSLPDGWIVCVDKFVETLGLKRRDIHVHSDPQTSHPRMF
jgi:hypothetical protein